MDVEVGTVHDNMTLLLLIILFCSFWLWRVCKSANMIHHALDALFARNLLGSTITENVILSSTVPDFGSAAYSRYQMFLSSERY